MSELRIEELSARTIVAVNALSLKPGQEQFVTPVSYSVAAAVNDPNTTWQRVVLNGDSVLAFIQGSFDKNAEPPFSSILWRINVNAEEQGQGVGRFAVIALAKEAKSRGLSVIHVIYEPGDLGPEAFFARVGFTPIGETEYGEVIARLEL
ncbi:MAG: GNAT family N-acetyltransferase [Mycetocola sp.]